MSEWTKRDQARVAFLNAAVERCRLHEQVDPARAEVEKTYNAEFEAWVTYRDLIDGKAENSELDPNRWYCPHCGAERPAWNFQLVGLVSMGIGAIQYLNVFCGNESCRKLITVMGVGFLPEAAAIAAAKNQMRVKSPGGLI